MRWPLPLRWRIVLVTLILCLGWAAHTWPQSEARLLLTVSMATVLILNARSRGEWWF
jgi:hypothetical protein